MYQFQNYSMNNYAQNQQPMYQQYQNPYMDRLAGLQSFQANIRQQQAPMPIAGLSGGIVDDFGMISANDVPMDNIGALFMKRDGSELQHKMWTSDGKIITTSYKPYIEPKTEDCNKLSSEPIKIDLEPFNGVLEAFNNKIDALSFKIDDLMKKNAAKSKKEVE